MQYLYALSLRNQRGTNTRNHTLCPGFLSFCPNDGTAHKLLTRTDRLYSLSTFLFRVGEKSTYA